MRKAIFVLAIVAQSAGFVSLPASAQPECLKPGDTITGKLRLVATRHPNGTRIEAYQQTGVKGVCVTDMEEFCDGPPTIFHVLPADTALGKQLVKLQGKTLTMRGEGFFCSHTAWHIGDAVVQGGHAGEIDGPKLARRPTGSPSDAPHQDISQPVSRVL